MAHLQSRFRIGGKQTGLIFIREQGLDLEVWDGGPCPRWSMGVVRTARQGPESQEVRGIPRVRRWLLVLPAYLCTTRYIQLPTSRVEEIAAMLEFEVPQLAPCSAQLWTWDFEVIRVGEDGAAQVLVVLSPLSVVESALEQAHALGIEPSLVTVGAALGVMRPPRGDRGEGTRLHGYLSWDHGSLDFSALDGSKLVFLRGVRICGHNSHTLEEVEAEMGRNLSMLRERGLDAGELSVRVGGTDPEASLLAERLRQSASVPANRTCVWEPYDGVRPGGTVVPSWPGRRGHIPRINLLPQHRKAKERRARRRRELLRMGLHICVIALLVLACLRMSVWRQTRALGQYQRRIDRIAPLAQRLQFLQGQLAMIRTQVQGSVSMLDIIGQMYELLPQDVTIHYLSIDQDCQMVMRAQAKCLSQAFDCIDPLEQSASFANVRQSYAHLRELEGQILIDFELRADLEKQPVGEAAP